MKKIPLLITMLAMTHAAFAAEIQPLAETEISGGAECVIINQEGKVLLEPHQIKLDGKLTPIQSTNITSTSKSWKGDGVQIVFTVTKGKLLETPDGGFSTGKGAKGTLAITYKGNTTQKDAQEECWGAD